MLLPGRWHEEEVTSISDDDVQVYNEDGTPRPAPARTVRSTITARPHPGGMVTLDYDGNVIAWWAVWAKRPRAFP